ncbi:MAG TPA: dihydrodipicolinate reductase [bacterium]|nr:dihydrodipicolinate reductase [bacterium]
MAGARVIAFGLGPIGVGIAEVALEHGHQIVGAVDIDPAKVGRPLAAFVRGAGEVSVERAIDPLLNAGADVVLHSTQSRIDQVMPQLVPLLDAGLNVISTCEELAYPWYHHPKEAALLDGLARDRGARLVGVGINPGFVMDVLPVVLAAPCRRVERITVERVVDVNVRRLPLQRKVGVGLTAEAFRRGVQEGTIGHVGLPQSVAMIAAALRWPLEAIEETIEPEMDAARAVRGLHQVCRGRQGGREVITLDLTMVADADRPRDVVRIEGTPPIAMEIAGGIPGDLATWAIVVNAIPRLLASRPGLLIPTQLPAAT